MKCSKISAGFVAVAGFLVLTLLPVLTEFDQHSWKSFDMDKFHVPVVRSFAEQLPAVDLSDYNSATGPGTHLFLAVLTRVLGPSETMLQVATCLFGALLIGIGWWYASLTAKPWIALAAIAPLGVNPYTLGNAIWVMTDNLSLLFLAIAIGSSIFLQPRTGILVGTSLAMISGILVRQINIWVVAGVWIAALLGCPPLRGKLPWRDELDNGFSAGRIVVISIGILACFGVLLFFIILWEGLVPPSMQGLHTRGINVAVTPFVLTLLAVYGAPAWLLLGPRVLANRQIGRWTALGALLGLCVGVLLESKTGLDLGRKGAWMWLVAENLPEVAGRSLFLVFGALLWVAGCLERSWGCL